MSTHKPQDRPPKHDPQDLPDVLLPPLGDEDAPDDTEYASGWIPAAFLLVPLILLLLYGWWS